MWTWELLCFYRELAFSLLVGFHLCCLCLEENTGTGVWWEGVCGRDGSSQGGEDPLALRTPGGSARKGRRHAGLSESGSNLLNVVHLGASVQQEHSPHHSSPGAQWRAMSGGCAGG